MKPPKKIKVGPFVYNLTLDKKSFDNYGAKVKDLEAVGYTDTFQSNIHISPDINIGMQREVILHEVFHSIYHMMGLGGFLPEEKEELIVNALGVAMLQVIRDNPNLMLYLQEKDT